MGMSGWFHWLSDEITKWEALLAMTKNEDEIKYIKEHIAELKSKLNK